MRASAFRPFLVVFLLTVGALAGQPAAPAGPQPTNFFETANFTQPKLSPNGRQIGILLRFDDVHDALMLIDTETRGMRPLIQYPTMSVTQFWWKSDDLMMILVEENGGTRTFRSLDLKTKKVNDLEVLMHNGVQLLDRLPDDPEDMLVAVTPAWADSLSRASEYVRPSEIALINLRTGRRHTVEDTPATGGRWFINRQGEAVGVWGYDTDHWCLIWRTGPKAKWERLNQPKNQPPEWEPVGVAPDQHRFIVTESKQTPFTRVCLLDPASGAMEEIPGAAGADVDVVWTWGHQEEPAIVRYQTAGPENNLRFLKPEAEEVYRWLGTLFPAVKFSCVSFSQDDQRMIVRLWSDQNPGVFFLVDRQTKKPVPIGVMYHGINPNLMAPTRVFNFTASDGLALTGRITLPKAAKPPLVLMVGPRIDSALPVDFNPTVQFLASRGYAIAYIGHRGVGGLGRDFGVAGDLQIATGMARDLAEGIKWLGEQGWIDPRRVALFNDSFGGVIGLPLAAGKDLFRAMVSYNPPMDLENWRAVNFLQRANRTDDQLLAVVGDKKGLEAYRLSLDPMAAAGKIAIPSFYFFSRNNLNNVPAEAKKLDALLKKNGRSYQLVTGDSRANWNYDTRGPYPEWKETARHFEEIGAFLDKNL